MAFTARTNAALFCVPAFDVFSPDMMNATTAAVQPSSFTETDFNFDVLPSSSNASDPNGRYPAELKVTGSPTISKEMTITISASGYPDQTSAAYFSDDAGVSLYGWTNPSIQTDVNTIAYDNGGAGYRLPRGVALSSGSVLYVMEKWDGTDTVAAVLVPYTTGVSGAAVNVWSAGGTGIFTDDQHPSPDVDRLGDVIYCASLEQISSSAWLRLDYSKDSGTTWNIFRRKLIEFPNTADSFDQVRLAIDPSSKAMVVLIRKYTAAPVYTSLSYISTDGGNTWRAISSGTVSNAQLHDLKCVNGVFIMTYVLNSDNELYSRVLSPNSPSWFTNSASVDDFYVSTSEYESHFAMCVTHDKTLVVYGRNVTNHNKLVYAISKDNGKSWGTYDEPYPPDSNTQGVITDELQTANLMRQNGAVYALGTVHLVGALQSASSVDYTVLDLKFGSVNNLPQLTPMNTVTWYPANYPSQMGWNAFTGAGAESLTSSAGSLVYQIVANTAQGFNGIDPNIGLSGGIVKVTFDLLSGGSTSTDDIAISLQWSGDGANYAIVNLRFSKSASQVQMYDAVAAANKGSAATFTTGATLEIMLAVTSGHRASAWWKAPTMTKWTAIAVNQSCTTALGATRLLRFGSLVVTAGATTSRWKMVSAVSTLDDAFSDGVFTASEVTGIPISFDPMQVPFNTGTLFNLFGRGGPFSPGDAYTATTRASAGVERMFDVVGAASPRESFQSGTVAVGSSISAGTLEYAIFDQGVGYNARIHDMLAVFVLGSDFYQVLVDRYDGAAFQNLVTHNCYEDPFGTNPTWTRSSTTDLWIRPNDTNGYPRYFRRDELKGSYLEITSGAVFTVFAEIVHNTEGHFTTASGAKQMAIQLANTPTGASAAYVLLGTGGAGANSRMRIHWRNSGTVFGQSSNSSRYYRVQWRYNGLKTNGQAGKIVICRVMPFFRQEGSGAQWGYISNDEVTQLAYGFTKTRRVAPMERSARIPFRQLQLNQARYQGGTLVNTFGPASTARQVADSSLDEIVATLEQEGLAKGIVYVQQIELSSDPVSTPKSIHGNNTWIYGSLGSDVNATVGHGQRFGNSSLKGNHSVDFEIVIKERV